MKNIERKQYFPTNNFSDQVDDLGMHKSILWATINGKHTEIDLNKYLGFKTLKYKSTVKSFIVFGKGFFDHPLFECLELMTVERHFRLCVTTKDKRKSWIDLDYFIGVFFNRLIIIDCTFPFLEISLPLEARLQLCSYYNAKYKLAILLSRRSSLTYFFGKNRFIENKFNDYKAPPECVGFVTE